MRAVKSWLFAVVASAQNAACATDPGTPPPVDRCAEAKGLRTSAYPPGGPRDAGEEADVASRLVPGGFGGLYQDRARNILMVTLKDVSQQEPALVRLGALMGCDAIYPGWLNRQVTFATVEVRPGDFTGRELAEARAAAAGAGQDPGVLAAEFDPESNRIWLGAVDQAAADRITARMAAAGVPATRLRIELEPADTVAAITPVTNPVTGADFATGFFFRIPILHRNTSGSPVYQGRCIVPGSRPLRHFPLFTLEKWTGTDWREVYWPVCEAIILGEVVTAPPQGVRADTVEVVVNTRLNAFPTWNNPRTAGFYRLVVPLYRSATGFPPILGDPLPAAAGTSPHFVLRR